MMKSIEKRNGNLERHHKYKEDGKNFNRYIQKFKEKHPGYDTEYNKQYNKSCYENNRERILKMVGEKIVCEYCNKAVRKDYVHKHIRTPKHTKNVKDYEEKPNELKNKTNNSYSSILFMSISIYNHKHKSLESFSNCLYNPIFLISFIASFGFKLFC